MNKAVVLMSLAAVLISGCGGPAPAAQQVQSGGAVTISGAWVRSASQTDRTAAAYMLIKNTGSEEVRLVSAASNAANTLELHETKATGGMMQMSPVKDIQIPAGGQAELKPGGLHIMLIGLTRDLKTGDQVNLSLTFEKGVTVNVTAEVKQQ